VRRSYTGNCSHPMRVTWFITEGSEEEDGDWLLFGYVIGLDEEWGYFLLSEIASIRAHSG